MRCARHKRPIDRRYGADLRFSLAGRALGESAQRLPFGKIRRRRGDCDGSVVNISRRERYGENGVILEFICINFSMFTVC